MPDWEERLTAASHPSLRLEHVVRYQAAQSIVLGSDVWCDLGCGTAVASEAALAGFEGQVVLVDVVREIVDQAVRRFPGAVGVVADLATESGRQAVREEVTSRGPGCLTCFEVLEHIDGFAPLIAMLGDLATLGWTVVLSMPNDSFWTIENPYHLTTWSDSAVAELLPLLPEPHVVGLQIALSGSCVVRDDARVNVATEVTAGNIPSQFLIAFGPRCAELSTPAAIMTTDLDSQRSWERQREADLAYFKSRVERR